MWPAAVTLGKWQFTWWGLWLPVVFVLGSFILWRRIREDYDEEEIISLVILMALGAAVASLVLNLLIYRKTGWWPVGAAAGGVAVLVTWCVKKGWEVWECLDAAGDIVLLAGVGVALGWGIKAWPLAGILVLGLIVTELLRRGYRKIKLYKSGKPGLSGLVALACVFFAQMVVAIKLPGGLYWVGLEVSQLVSGLLGVGCLIVIYLRAGYRLWPSKKIQKKQQ